MSAAPATGYRYSIIPGDAPTDPRVKPRDLQVLCLLGRHIDKKGWCRRSEVQMAKELNCGRATIGRALARLCELGYLERLAAGRGNTAPKEGQQPFAAYWYRVKIDGSEDSIPVGAQKWARPKSQAEIGHVVPDQDGQEVPTSYRAPLIEPSSSEGPKLNSIRAARDEEWSDVDLEEDEKAWAPEIEAVYRAIPKADPSASMPAAKARWEAIPREDRPTRAELIACLGAYAAELARINAHRPSDKPQGVRHLNNWIKDRSYAGFLPEVRIALARDAAQAERNGQLETEHGAEALANMRAMGLSDAEIVSWTRGVKFEKVDDHWVITVSMAPQLQRFGTMWRSRVDRAFGENTEVHLVRVAS